MNRAEENARLLERAARGDRAAEAKLVENNLALVRSVARRFVGRGQELDDLVQLGCLGLLKAVRGFDTSFGTAFSTYAVPLISGEIKRFLRDDGLIKVSRETKGRYALLARTGEAFERERGRSPKIGELAALCGVTCEQAAEAFEACGTPLSLQEKLGDADGMSVEETVADESLSEITEHIALEQAIGTLDEREQTIVRMRYYKDMTQVQVAERLGLTQVKVSRAEKRIKEKLRGLLEAS